MHFNINQHNIMSLYSPLLNSRTRNAWFKKAITEHCKDRIVLDMGTGTGLLANYALEAGAAYVYCVESEPTVAKLADDILAQCHDRSRFKVIACDFNHDGMQQHVPAGSVDVFVSETMSWSLFDQGILQSWQRALKFLKPDGICIPNEITADAWITPAADLQHYVITQHVDAKSVLSDAYFDACQRLSQSDDYGYCIMLPARHIPRPRSVLHEVITASYSNKSQVLSFEVHAAEACQVSIIGRIHAPNMKPLTMAHCDTTGWHMVASMYLPRAGTYEISYRYNHFNSNSWIADQIR